MWCSLVIRTVRTAKGVKSTKDKAREQLSASIVVLQKERFYSSSFTAHRFQQSVSIDWWLDWFHSRLPSPLISRNNPEVMDRINNAQQTREDIATEHPKKLVVLIKRTLRTTTDTVCSISINNGSNNGSNDSNTFSSCFFHIKSTTR